MTRYIDTHAHLDGEEFREDLPLVIKRAKEAGAAAVLLPGVNAASVKSIKTVCKRYPDYCYGMIGLHPEDVRSDYAEVVGKMKVEQTSGDFGWLAVGEIGLDFHFTREYEKEQSEAFRMQVEWAAEVGLPLSIHCRKAQNELVKILREYDERLNGGVIHCFTGNEREAEQLLELGGFALGIGGVLTFKSSRLAETLAAVVPLSRVILETDAPYMAPVPLRGKRNESAFIPHIIDRLAEVYGMSDDEICRVTTENAARVFRLKGL